MIVAWCIFIRIDKLSFLLKRTVYFKLCNQSRSVLVERIFVNQTPWKLEGKAISTN